MGRSQRVAIRTLAWRFLRGRVGSAFALGAILLTTLLFGALCTTVGAIHHGMQQSAFRRAGCSAQGSFKDCTEAQAQALASTDMLRDWGRRCTAGTLEGKAFRKMHAELSAIDPSARKWFFLDLSGGTYPSRDDEVAVDEGILRALGVSAKIGERITLDIRTPGRTIRRSFVLSGWLAEDDALPARHAIVTESAAESILREAGIDPHVSLYVQLPFGWGSIESRLEEVREAAHLSEDDVSIGVNWGYTSDRIWQDMGMETIVTLLLMGMLMFATGYLMIANVFHIFIENDVRFLALLSTVGMTSKQVRKMIRWQGLMLFLLSAPLGLALGWMTGGPLAAKFSGLLDGVGGMRTASPWVFLAAAACSLVTVMMSISRPARTASRIAPVHAVSYVGEPSFRRRKSRRVVHTPLGMAVQNLRRSRRKTALSMASIAMAILVFALTTAVVGGLDGKVFVRHFQRVDYLVGMAAKLHPSSGLTAGEAGLDAETLRWLETLPGRTAGGEVLGSTSIYLYGDAPREYNPMTEDVGIYGFDAFGLEKLTVVRGCPEEVLSDPEAIIAVVPLGDRDEPLLQEDTPEVGERVTMTRIDEVAVVDAQSGKEIPKDAPVKEGRKIRREVRQKKTRSYRVCAVVGMPYTLSYRFFGRPTYIVNAANLRDDPQSFVMYAIFDVAPSSRSAVQSALEAYTQDLHPEIDFESDATFGQSFAETERMFRSLGYALAAVMALVGILNFFHTMVASISARRHELAVLSAVGMTHRQRRAMLSAEGIICAVGAWGIAAVLTALLLPILGPALERNLWFYAYRFDLRALFWTLPVFCLLGIFVPWLSARSLLRRSVVESLRMEG